MNSVIFCQVIEEKLNRKLDFTEKNAIDEYLMQIKIEPGTSIKLAFKYHVEQVFRYLQKREPNIDLREYQLANLGTSEEDGQAGPKYSEAPTERELTTAETAKLEALFLIEVAEVYDLSKAIAPKSKLKYNYLMLDSDNCFEISDSRDKFTWLLQEEHPKLQQGYINLHSKMRNIVMARLGRMTMAHQSEAFTDEALARNRFAFGFEEFASQALITPEGVKFQFIEFLPEYDGGYGTTIVLSPFNANRGWFRFRERFKMLDKLSLTITNLNTSQKFTMQEAPVALNAIQTNGIGFGSPYYGPASQYLQIPAQYLPVNYYYGPAGFEYDHKDVGVEETYVLNGLNTGIPAIDNAYNGSTIFLVYRGQSDIFYINGAPFGPALGPSPPFAFNVTLTLQYAPRFTGILELISEDDDDDDTPI